MADEPRFENDERPLDKRVKEAIADLIAEENDGKETEIKVASTPDEALAMALSIVCKTATSFRSKDDFTAAVAVAVAKLVVDQEMFAGVASAIVCGVATGQCLPLPLEDAREHGLTPRSFLEAGCLPALREDEAFFEFLEGRDRDMLEAHFNMESATDVPEEEAV